MKIRPGILEGLLLFIFVGYGDEMKAGQCASIKKVNFDTVGIGQPVGPFSLTTPGGKELNSDSLKGKIVVLDFWASWCAPCKKLTHETDSLLTDYHGKDNFQMVGVGYRESRKEAALKYWKESGYRFPMASDNDVLGKAVHAGNPTILIVDKSGIIRGRWDKYTPGAALEIRGMVDALAKEEIKAPVKQIVSSGEGNGDGPVAFVVKATATMRPGSEGTVEVNFTFDEGWYGYAETSANIAGGWIPTKVDIVFPEGFEAVGKLQRPAAHFKAAAEVYDGKDVKFVQKFRLKLNGGHDKDIFFGEYPIKVTVYYQTCNEEMCLPPVIEEKLMKVNYAPIEMI